MVRPAVTRPEFDAAVRGQRLPGDDEVKTFPDSAGGVDPPGDDQRVQDGPGVLRRERGDHSADVDGG